MRKILLIATAVLLAASCNKKNKNEAEPLIVEKPDIEVSDGRFTPEVMWGLGRMGEKCLSPDGKTIAYTLTYTDMKANKNNAEIYTIPANGATSEQQTVRRTTTASSEWNIVWKDNSTLLFCRDNEIHSLDLATGNEKTLATFPNGVEGFRLSPNGSQILYISTRQVERKQDVDKLYNGLDKTTGRINEDLMYRHWDNWVDEYPQIFLADLGETLDIEHATAVVDSTFECPMRPWGGIEQFCFSPDGKQIAYTCRKKTGKDYALSTNSDIFLYNITNATTRNLSDGIMGYDQNPVFSHDGTKIAWESMQRDGYESDKTRLMVLDLNNSAMTDYTEAFDYGVSGIVWSDDDSELMAVVMYRGMNEIFAFNTTNKSIRQITHGYHDIHNFELQGNKIYATQVSISYPATIYSYNTTDSLAEGTKLSTFNDELLSQVRMGKVEENWIKTADGKDMLTWLIYPYNYDSTKVYPALLFCEGGPQSMVSQFWSTRWNFQVMSGAGYFVIAPNRRGCPGFGTAWCEEISGDYGGLCMQDYMTATDYFAKNKTQIDPERIGACGASFGGYSIYWLAGHNETKRFKAFLAHNGMFNFEQQCLETEEYWFTNWDLGGPYWTNSPQTRKSYSNSPHLFVDKWNTPLCVVHSEFDFRIVASQGMAAYNAAKLRGLDARYLYFPDETHWVLKPQNSLLWHRNFIDWFDKYLKQ